MADLIDETGSLESRACFMLFDEIVEKLMNKGLPCFIKHKGCDSEDIAKTAVLRMERHIYTIRIIGSRLTIFTNTYSINARGEVMSREIDLSDPKSFDKINEAIAEIYCIESNYPEYKGDENA